MTARVQQLRLFNTNQNPPALRAQGEFWLNYPDLRLGFIDTSQQPQQLLAARRYATTASYVQDDVMVRSGQLYRARAAVSPSAFDATKWTWSFDPAVGFGLTFGTDASTGQLGAANAVSAPNLLINAYAVSGGYKAAQTGMSGRLALSSPSGSIQFQAARSVATGSAPVFTSLLDLDPVNWMVVMPQGKLLVKQDTSPSVGVWDTTAGKVYGMWTSSSILNLGQLNTIGIPAVTFLQLRESDKALIALGPAFVKEISIDPNASYEWRIYRDATTGDHIQQYRANWTDNWANATGMRSWNSPSGVAMSLTGAGVLTTLSDIHAGRNLYWGAEGSYLNSNSTYGQVRFSSDGWRLEYVRATGMLRYVNYANSTLWSLDATGNVIQTGSLTATGDINATGNVTGTSLSTTGDIQTTSGFLRGAGLAVSGTANVGSLISSGVIDDMP